VHLRCKKHFSTNPQEPMTTESIQSELENIEDRVEYWLDERAAIDISIENLLATREEINTTLGELVELQEEKEAELGQVLHSAG